MQSSSDALHHVVLSLQAPWPAKRDKTWFQISYNDILALITLVWIGEMHTQPLYPSCTNTIT